MPQRSRTPGLGQPPVQVRRHGADRVRAILGRRPGPVRLVRQGRSRPLRRERRGLRRGQLLVQGLPGPGHGARLRHRLVPGPRGKPTQPHALVQVLEAAAASPGDARGSRRRRSSTGWTFAGQASTTLRSGTTGARSSVGGRTSRDCSSTVAGGSRAVAQVDAGRALQGVRVAALPEGLRGAARPGRVHLRAELERPSRDSGGRTRTCDTRIMIPLL